MCEWLIQVSSLINNYCTYVHNLYCSYAHRMMMIINVLICLIILTSQCICVHSKVININSNNGNDSTECCINGTCACSSLYNALLNITSNTIINITSKSVALHNTTTMGSGNLTNITITGSNVTIMCNNSGSVYCESCDHVRIEGITWDSCGDPNGTNIAGMTFNGTRNISLVNCTFQHSLISAVYLLEVSDNILIQHCNFLSNIPINDFEFNSTLNILRHSPRYSNSSNITNITITIFESYFYNNGGCFQNITGISSLNIDIDDNSVINCYVILKATIFVSNRVDVNIGVRTFKLVNIQLIEILAFNNSFVKGIRLSLFSYTNDNVALSINSSTFKGNYGSDVWCFLHANITSITINNSTFIDGNSSITPTALGILAGAVIKSEITFYGVQFSNNVISWSVGDIYGTGGGAVYIAIGIGDVEINMSMVNFTSNQYTAGNGGALYFLLFDTNRNCNIFVKECEFVNNKSPGHGAALYIYTGYSNKCHLQIADTLFDRNIAGNSVVYIAQDGFSRDNNMLVQLNTSTFKNNVASSLYLSACDMHLSGILLFKNNIAENGGAMYLNQGTTVTIDDGATVQFIANTATLNGGAIYVDFLCGNIINGNTNTFSDHKVMNFSTMYIFINNSATIAAGNSLYFSIPRFCSVNTNISDSDCILYVPCHFNYSQPVNGKMMKNIPCDLNYTLFNGTGAPIVTSPHELRLYFPYNEGYKISSASKHNTYFVRNNILGQEVKFTGAVFDYFGKPTEPTLFNIRLQCSNATDCSTYTLIGGNHDHILTQSIDNFTVLNVKFKGNEINHEHINLTLILTSLSYSLNATLVVELIPCVEHPGYMYSEDSQMCVCYHANVKCNNDGNEIKRGYWFGNITGKATTSLCPNHYCRLTGRKQTSEGYFELPNTINAQCNYYRVGRACGECSPGCTLSYDSTDCISINQCGPGWTVLVIVLTYLYWIAVVACVFMCFKFHMSLGHLYGIIYYYSIVGILLGNNPYILDGAFQFVSILSSFAQLTPQFLGKLCFVKGLSGIDQLFIHYSHAVAVSLLLLLIVVAARCSARITLIVSRHIIRVICLLILLSYTSIASTSLQLLQPLRFTDVEQWYTYSSPHIKYFHQQHAVYGIVAVICELVVVVGLSLLLLLEPVLSRKINFIRIKPLLDQFQGCYKDKYRWFAAYYLLCRQVIFLIVYTFNSNYYNMLFYLQTACIVIALIHIWFQPYRDELLNALDGVMLLIMVVIVNINTFTFLHEITTEISLILVMLPLFLYCTIAVKKIVHTCFEKKHRVGRSHAHQYNQINNADNSEDENAGLHSVVR